MWKKYGRAGQATDDNIMRRMRFACRLLVPTLFQKKYHSYVATCFDSYRIIRPSS